MTPIEMVAAALDAYADTLPEQSEFRCFLRSHKHGAARAALLALAEIEGRPAQFDQSDWKAFQQVCSYIAKQGNPMPDAPPPPAKNADGQ